MTQTATNLSTRVVTGKVRFSYANVFQPKASDDGAPKYSITLLIPKKDKTTLGKIKAAIEAAKASSAAVFGGKVPANLKTSLHDGDKEKPQGGEYGPEAAGCWVLNCSSKQKPGIVDENRQPILDSTEFYSGCYGRASVNFYAYNVKGGKGIGCGLNNIQKLTDGEPLGGNRTRPEDDFADDDEEYDDILG